jgi:hypothetical protein
MSVNLDRITEISRAVAVEHFPTLEIVGVTSGDGGSDRVEILATITGCHQDPCRVVVNVSRAEPDAFERELRTKLHEALIHHRAQP